LLSQLLIAIVPAIISGLVSYFGSKRKYETELKKVEKQSDSRFKELEKTLNIELERIKIESENRIKELREKVDSDLKLYGGKKDVDAVNELSMKAFNGEIDFNKLGDTVKQISKLGDMLDEFNKK
jgi:hypothetical protein